MLVWLSWITWQVGSVIRSKNRRTNLEQIKQERDTIVGFRDELFEETVVGEMQVHLELAEQLRDGGELLKAHLPLGGEAWLLPPLAQLALPLAALRSSGQVELQHEQ